MNIINTINRLRRTVGLKEFTPEYTESSTDELVIPPVDDSTLSEQFPLNIEGDAPMAISSGSIDMTTMKELVPTDNQKTEISDEYDDGYLQYSAEVVGYDNREQQWNIYRSVMVHTTIGDSLLDFGCGRGDIIPFYMAEYNTVPIYVGIDSNEPLINVGKELYPNAQLMLMDWFTLDDTITCDWSININSCNLRYDADTTVPNDEYTKNTIRKMYQHCTKGLVIMLLSDLVESDGVVIKHDPGAIFNWAQKEFNNVALDHTPSKDVFCLIIYK